MTELHSFIVGIVAAGAGPFCTLLLGLILLHSQRKTQDKVDEVHGLVNSKIGELLEVTRSDARQQGATEERQKQNPEV